MNAKRKAALGRIKSLEDAIGKMREDLLEEARKLPFPERIELAEAIWGSVPEDASADDVAVPQSHREILDQRLAAEERSPDSASASPEVRERLQRKL
jgi:putative addiction module component (TIGR02574 family)